MVSAARLLQLLRRPPPLQVWFDEAYRLPLPSLEASAGIEPRRVDFVAWFLVEHRAIRASQLRTPAPISFEDLLRVHTPEYLESLQDPKVLARIYGVDPSEISVEALLQLCRLSCGATLEGARSVLAHGGMALNLGGGFHHAFRAKGGGFCPFNDVAVAIASLRAQGFSGQVAILDLDAHPPDGTADCLADDPSCWIGSLSASRWTPLPNVDETVLEEGAGDEAYLAALRRVLGRMPAPELAFVIAGGDVLHGDRFGKLGLSLDGARQRDRLVAARLRGVPSMWLPGGGYHADAWRVLAGTGLVLAGRGRRRIPRSYDPLAEQFAHVSRQLVPSQLNGQLELSMEDLEAALGHGPPPAPRLLGFYTPSGIEYGLHRQGILGHVRRLGYDDLRVVLDSHGAGDRMRLFGRAGGAEHLLIEAELDRRRIGADEVLFINWLTLRNPRATFTGDRPRLPGQNAPGLGLGREATALFALIARRLSLSGVVFAPAWFHLAHAARSQFQFVDPRRHGRFEALLRDLGGTPVPELTQAIADGRVRMDGQPYAWEATEMVKWLSPRAATEAWTEEMEAERDRHRFTLAASSAG